MINGLMKLHLVAVLILLMSSCQRYVSVDTSSVDVFEEGGTVDLNVSAAGSWNVTTYADWISLSKESGFGDAVVTVTLDEWQNTSSDIRRTGSITFKAGNTSAKVVVRQMVYGIFVDPPVLNFEEGYMGYEKVTVKNQTDHDWTAERGADWIWDILPSTGGQGDRTVEINVDWWDSSGEDKETYVRFNTGDSYVDLKVTWKDMGFNDEPIH